MSKPLYRITGTTASGKPRARMIARPRSPVGTGVREVEVIDRKQARMMGLAYAGASHVMKELQGWFAPSGDADSAIRELDIIRRRAYDLARNAPIVTGAVTTHRVETIGPGLKLQSRVNHRLLERNGISIDEDEIADIEDNIESLFKLWAADPRECDIEQTKSFADHQDLMLVTEILAGEGLCLAVQQMRRDSPWMMRLQAVHPSRLSNPDFRPSSVRMDGGVERDASGAVIRYHFLESHPGTTKVDARQNVWRGFGRYTRRSGRQQVYHVFRADEPGQSRGVPLLAPVIHKLKQMDRYTDAEIMAAVVGGMLSVIFASEQGEFPDWDDEELKEGAQRLGVDTDSNLVLGHGTMMTAPDGMKPHVVSPGRPNPSFDPFVTSILRQVGVSLELPFEVLVQHFQSSYSAARAALLKAWKAIITRRHRIATHFCTPVYRSWLQEAHDARLLNLEGWDATGNRGKVIRAAWAQCSWIGPARGSIDPVKEYNAELDLNDALIRPKEDIAQLLTGEDWHDSVHKISREQRLETKLGLKAGRRTATDRRDDEAADERDTA